MSTKKAIKCTEINNPESCEGILTEGKTYDLDNQEIGKYVCFTSDDGRGCGAAIVAGEKYHILMGGDQVAAMELVDVSVSDPEVAPIPDAPAQDESEEAEDSGDE